jgi:hypothetical protein
MDLRPPGALTHHVLRYLPAMKLGNDPQSLLALTPLERSVLRAAAPRLGEASALWQAQCDQARVLIRTHSGVGFVTKLGLPDDIPGLPANASGSIGAVHASHPDLGEPAEFLVQLKAGRLSSIEAYCYEGMWPADDAGFRVEAGSP